MFTFMHAFDDLNKMHWILYAVTTLKEKLGVIYNISYILYIIYRKLEVKYGVNNELCVIIYDKLHSKDEIFTCRHMQSFC